jgi:hypothetical protein
MPTKKTTPPVAAPKKAAPRKKPVVDPVAVPAPVETPAPVVEAVVPPAEAPAPVLPVEPVIPLLPGPAAGKPDKVQTIAVLTLISGITNILWPLTLYGIIGASTLFIGCFFLPLFVAPIILGIYEILYAAKLLPAVPQPTRPSQTIAILEIVNYLTGNLVSLAAGIVALILYSDSEVKEYFSRLNA